MDIRLYQALQALNARALAIFQYIPCRLADVRDAYV